jgi:hypothetical protein
MGEPQEEPTIFFGNIQGTYADTSSDHTYTYFSNTNFPDPNPSTWMAQGETAKEKRDRLSREENKRCIEARRRGGKVRY